MNKGQQFWIDMWQEGQIPFHKNEIHSDLIKYWPDLNLKKNATILVPLCGKSLDMLWLVQQGFKVIGIELCELAVKQFSDENQLNLKQESNGLQHHYFNDFISIWVADFFSLDTSFIAPVDAVYDRAALVALPESLRPAYVEKCLTWLKSNGTILLKTLSYNQQLIQGPPYSVPDEEVLNLYQKECAQINRIKHSERVNDTHDHLFQKGLDKIIDNVWLLKKN